MRVIALRVIAGWPLGVSIVAAAASGSECCTTAKTAGVPVRQAAGSGSIVFAVEWSVKREWQLMARPAANAGE
jgi:hypothetical protein